jgi:hypothetical protein
LLALATHLPFAASHFMPLPHLPGPFALTATAVAANATTLIEATRIFFIMWSFLIAVEGRHFFIRVLAGARVVTRRIRQTERFLSS